MLLVSRRAPGSSGQTDATRKGAQEELRERQTTHPVQDPAPIDGETLPKRKRPWSFFGMAPRMFGRVGVGVVVTGVVLGTMLGTVGAMSNRPSAPPVVYADTEPKGTEIETLVSGLSDVVDVAALGDVDREEAFDALGRVTFSTRLERGHLLSSDESTGLEIKPGTRLTATLSQYGLSIRAHPALEWRVDWRPDPEISELTFDFGTGRFRARAAGFGPDGWYESSVVEQANHHLIGRLPEDMRRPGYDPFADPSLERNMQILVDRLTSTADPSTGEPRVSDFSKLCAPTLSVSFRVPEAMTVPLQDGYTAWVDAGTRVEISLRCDGTAVDPTLQALQVSFREPVEIAKGSERGRFARMELGEVTITPNGQIDLRYDLGPEQTIDGLKALVLLTAILAEPRAVHGNPTIERTRLEGARADIQAHLDGKVEPKLVELIRTHDGLIDGLSLLDFFGIEDR